MDNSDISTHVPQNTHQTISSNVDDKIYSSLNAVENTMDNNIMWKNKTQIKLSNYFL